MFLKAVENEEMFCKKFGWLSAEIFQILSVECLLEFSTFLPLDTAGNSLGECEMYFDPKVSAFEFTKEVETDVYDEFWRELELLNGALCNLLERKVRQTF